MAAKRFVFKNNYRGFLSINFDGIYPTRSAETGRQLTLSEEEYDHIKMYSPKTLYRFLEPVGFKFDKEVEVVPFEPEYYFELRDEKRTEILKTLTLEQLVSIQDLALQNEIDNNATDAVKQQILLAAAGK